MIKPLRAALPAAIAIACFSPPLAWAQSGGSSAPEGGGTAPVETAPAAAPVETAQAETAPAAQPVVDDGISSVVDDGISLNASEAMLLGRRVRFTGRVAGAGEGRSVSLQRLDPERGWVAVATVVTDAEGAFTATWKAGVAGSVPFRAVVTPEGTRPRAVQPSGSTTLTVYRSAVASTFYDRVTACGRNLRRSTLGVAHRTLPCGTSVTFFHGGRTLTVPVVDRGPYVRGRTWDLTRAAAKKLRFDGLGRIGWLVLPPATD